MIYISTLTQYLLYTDFQPAKPVTLTILVHTQYPNERFPFKNLAYESGYYSLIMSEKGKIEGIPNWLPWNNALRRIRLISYCQLDVKAIYVGLTFILKD